MSSGNTAPLTFDLQEDLLKRLRSLQRQTGVRSLSALVRFAVDRLDTFNVSSGTTVHKQISVRLSGGLRERLVRISKQKKVSMGALLRIALDALPADLTDFNPETNMPKKKVTKKKA